jgi:hypothetical protein
VTIAELAPEVVEAKRKDGRAPMYVADLKKRLARFCADFGKRPIAGITVEELDDWLRDLDCGPKTGMNFRANVGVLFSYAERRRMIDSNPILRTARPKLADLPAEIFTVDELCGRKARTGRGPDAGNRSVRRDQRGRDKAPGLVRGGSKARTHRNKIQQSQVCPPQDC